MLARIMKFFGCHDVPDFASMIGCMVIMMLLGAIMSAPLVFWIVHNGG